MAQRLTFFAALALALVLGPGLQPVARAEDPRPPAPLKIGVVDLGIVFKQYKKSTELEQKINDERDRLRRELEEQKKVISNLLKELDLLDPTTEHYTIKEDEKDAAVAKFDRTKKRLEETIKRRWEQYNLQLLEDIEAVVSAYGEEHHFTFILRVDTKPTEEAKLLMGLKSVLYHAKELDITPAVVEVLNRRYEMAALANPGGAAPSAGSATPASQERRAPAPAEVPPAGGK